MIHTTNEIQTRNTRRKRRIQKRSKTVEAPFGTFKQQYHINKLPFTKTQNIENIINLYSKTYNLKRIINLIKPELNEMKHIKHLKKKRKNKMIKQKIK